MIENDIIYEHNVKVFHLPTCSEDENYDDNLNACKKFLLNDKEGKGHIGATLNITTTQGFYVVELDENAASATSSSPMDQIYPLIKNFKGIGPKDKNLEEPITSYQFIGEGWMASGTPGKAPPLQYGDISSMANRREVLMETRIYTDNTCQNNMYEIHRYEDGPGVKEFTLLMNDSNNGEYISPKTPFISINKYQ